MKTLIIGAGITGASLAWHLARRGAEVLVVEKGRIAGQASGRSFGWINASFHENTAHFHLRAAAMEAWRALPDGLMGDAVTWPGCLCWENSGAGLEAQRKTLDDLGYRVEVKSRAQLAQMEPGLADLPEEGLFFPSEGVVDLERATHAFLRAAGDHGAQVVTGCAVTGLITEGGRVTGTETTLGRLAADHVVLAAGCGTEALLGQVGVRLPMPDRPGVILYTAPVAPVMSHVLVSPMAEIRQDRTGSIMAPTAAGHQSDRTERVTDAIEAMAARVLAHLRALTGQEALNWQEMCHAMRPVPEDGLPVIGATALEGLWVSVMHSGATLGALSGALLADWMRGGERDALLAPYGVARFGEV